MFGVDRELQTRKEKMNIEKRRYNYFKIKKKGKETMEKSYLMGTTSAKTLVAEWDGVIVWRPDQSTAEKERERERKKQTAKQGHRGHTHNTSVLVFHDASITQKQKSTCLSPRTLTHSNTSWPLHSFFFSCECVFSFSRRSRRYSLSFYLAVYCCFLNGSSAWRTEAV